MSKCDCWRGSSCSGVERGLLPLEVQEGAIAFGSSLRRARRKKASCYFLAAGSLQLWDSRIVLLVPTTAAIQTLAVCVTPLTFFIACCAGRYTII